MEEQDDDMSLHQAAAEGRGGLCEELLARGGDVNRMDLLGWTPLMEAVCNGHPQLAKELISRGANVSLRNHHGITAFTIGAVKFDRDLMRTLYEGLLPDQQQREGNMALLTACSTGSLTAVEWLLQNTQAQVNTISPWTGVTPLMLVAMTSGDLEVAELLLDSGADLTMTTALGQNVSELALAAGNITLFKLFNPSSKPKKSRFVKNTNSENIDPFFTENQMTLDIQSDIVLKNSPNRPVFKPRMNLLNEQPSTPLLSPSMRSVFLFSPQLRTSPQLNCQYNLKTVATPRKADDKTSNKGVKRKLSSVNTWLRKITKRRSKSSTDDDYEELNIRGQSGVDFLKVLKDVGLEEFFPIFKEQELDVWTFLSLTVRDLAAMGIDKASSQIRILAGIQALRTTQIY